MESRLYGPDDASWTFSSYQDGTLEQHYETGTVLWHAGYPANLYFDGVEHEGKDQPLTEAQYANTLRLTKWYFEQHPEWGAPELHKNLQEHGWLWPTACPSGRIPWVRLLADLQEEDVIAEEVRAIVEEALKGKIVLDLPLEYRVHVQNIGWQEWKKLGQMAGTTGQSLRLEAIEFRLGSV
jgi:hypothetical protein